MFTKLNPKICSVDSNNDQDPKETAPSKSNVLDVATTDIRAMMPNAQPRVKHAAAVGEMSVAKTIGII